MIDRKLLAEIKTAPRLFVASVGLAFASAVFLLWEYWLIARIIHGAFLAHLSLQMLQPLFIQAVIILFIRVAVEYVDDISARRLAGIIQRDMRTRIVHRVAQLGPHAMKTHQSGAMLNLLLEGVETLEAYFKSYLPQLIKALFIPILFLAIVLPLDRISALIFFVTLPLIPFFMILIGQWTRNASQRQWRLITQLSGYLQDVLRGLETLVVLGRSKEQGGKIAAISDAYRVSTLRVQRWAFVSSLALELVATISIALVAVSLGLRLVSGEMTYQIALFILLLAPEYYQPMRNLGSYFHAGLDAEEAAKDIFEFLSETEEIAESRTSEDRHFESLAFENVSYRYPGSTQDALHDVSFTLHANEFVALVGVSGSGKSTLMQLALGFLKPTKGHILINGQDMHAHPVENWQAQISYVPQQPYLFQGSIRENIAMADALDEVQKRHISQLAADTGLTDSLATVATGLDTVVGQGGIELSGGQQELLYLTRALYERRRILFLDEVTDNLDPASEQHVVQTLAHLLKEKTALVIAHRLTTVARAERILVFESGRLAEEGTPQDLYDQKGIYRRLLEGGRT